MSKRSKNYYGIVHRTGVINVVECPDSMTPTDCWVSWFCDTLEDIIEIGVAYDTETLNRVMTHANIKNLILLSTN